MKKFLLIFLAVIQLFLGVNASGLSIHQNPVHPNCYIQTDKTNHNILSVDFNNYENAVLRLNSNNKEIISAQCKEDNNTFFFDLPHNKNKFTVDKYNYGNKNDLIKSHNIFYCLSNEISTRAP